MFSLEDFQIVLKSISLVCIGHDFQLWYNLPINPEISVASLNNSLCLTQAKSPADFSGKSYFT